MTETQVTQDTGWRDNREWQRHRSLKTQDEEKQNTNTQHRKLKWWAAWGVNPGAYEGYAVPASYNTGQTYNVI
jgi:membrane-bound lytic murein transglycosylase B